METAFHGDMQAHTLEALGRSQQREEKLREALDEARIAFVQIQHSRTKHTPSQIATAGLRKLAALDEGGSDGA